MESAGVRDNTSDNRSTIQRLKDENEKLRELLSQAGFDENWRTLPESWFWLEGNYACIHRRSLWPGTGLDTSPKWMCIKLERTWQAPWGKSRGTVSVADRTPICRILPRNCEHESIFVRVLASCYQLREIPVFRVQLKNTCPSFAIQHQSSASN